MSIPTGLTYVCKTEHALERISERQVFVDRRHIDLDKYTFIGSKESEYPHPTLKFRENIGYEGKHIILVMRKVSGKRYRLITTYYENH